MTTEKPADALRREADRLDAEGKTRKWGLLDRNHDLTDDGTAGRFVALEPDQLRFAAILAEESGGAPDADSEHAAVVDGLRALHRDGTAETTLGLAALFEVMARGQWGETWRERRTTPVWQYDRHPGCASCTCPPRAAVECGGPGCEVTIVSVHDRAPAYCSALCRGRAAAERRQQLDIALIRILHAERDGLDEDEVCRRMGVDLAQVRAAERRVNHDGTLVARSKTEVPGLLFPRWRLALAIPGTPEPAVHPGVSISAAAARGAGPAST